MTPNRKPILVTGAHRTGTTWVGKMLVANGQLAYISEPLNQLHRPGVFKAPIPYWYPYITERNEQQYLAAFQDLIALRYHYLAELRSLRSARDAGRMVRDITIFLQGKIKKQEILLKDPFAVLSSDWCIKRLGCKVVVTIRHPAGFASSLKRLNWPFDFKHLLEQTELMEDWLESERTAMLSVQSNDVIAQAGLLWVMIYRITHEICRKNPEIHLVRHEDLAGDPLGGFESLYNRLDLEFNDRAKKTILFSSGTDNPREITGKNIYSVKLDSRASLGKWKKQLRPEEISRIRKITESVAGYYYPDSEW
jgi:hypothetical protein